MTDPSNSERELQHAGALLRSAMPPQDFAAGFADRVMARIVASEPRVPVSVQRELAVRRRFPLMAAAAALIIAALGVHNTIVTRSGGTSLLDAALGLQPVTADAAFASASDLTP